MIHVAALCAGCLIAMLALASPFAAAQETHVYIKGGYSSPPPFRDNDAKLNEYGINAIFVGSGGITDGLLSRARAEDGKMLAMKRVYTGTD